VNMAAGRFVPGGFDWTRRSLSNFRPVPFGIVQDKVYFPLSRLEKITDKIAKGLGIESGSLLCEKTACFQIKCPEEAYFVTN